MSSHIGDHFAACLVTFAMTSFFLQLLDNTFTGRSILEREFRDYFT